MSQLKLGFTTILGLLCTAIRVWLRLAARDLAWPIEWNYSGPRGDTVWAIREHAYQDLSVAILWFGLLVLLLVLATWVWAPPNHENERQV